MEDYCPLCKLRISDWMSSSGKVVAINQVKIHNSCLIDLELRKGLQTLKDVVQEFKKGT